MLSFISGYLHHLLWHNELKELYLSGVLCSLAALDTTQIINVNFWLYSNVLVSTPQSWYLQP